MLRIVIPTSIALLVTLGGMPERIVAGAESARESASAIELWPATLINAETKEPLPGIEVTVNASQAGQKEQALLTLVSDADGRLEIPLAAGAATFLHVTGPGWWTAGLPLVGEFDLDDDGKFDGPQRTAARSIELWRGTEVKGKLLTPAGEPAADVTLNAGVYIYSDNWKEKMGWETGVMNSWDHGDWPNWTRWCKTAADGTFSVTVPPTSARSWVRVGTGGLGFQAIDTAGIADKYPDHVLVNYVPFEVEVNGWAHNKQVVESKGVLDLGTLRLATGITLKGRVVDADGQPLSGIHLFTSSPHGPYAGRKVVSGRTARSSSLR